MENTSTSIQPTEKNKKQLPLLPFSYEQTLDSKKASYTERRFSGVSFGDKPEKPRTDQEIVEMVERENKKIGLFQSIGGKKDYQKNK